MNNEIQELNMDEIDAVNGGMNKRDAERVADGVVGALAFTAGVVIVVATSPAWVTAVGAAFVVAGTVSLVRAVR